MSVLSEKQAVEAALISILASVVTFTSPDTAANHVGEDVLPEPNTYWPYIVWTRPHYVATQIDAGSGYEMGNDDTDPNLYEWEYYSQLGVQTGQTVRQIRDTHDAFLEALIVYFGNQTRAHLPDNSGIRQVDMAGETITSDNNRLGPYALAAGSSVLVSTGSLTVMQKLRAPTS